MISIILVSIVSIGVFEGNILQKFVFSVLINAIWMLAEFLVGYGFILCGIDYMIPQFLRIVVVEIDCVNLNCMFKEIFS